MSASSHAPPSEALIVQWQDALLRVAADRDQIAYTLLFRHFAPRLKAYGLRMFGNEPQALELVQETLLNVWQKAHLYVPERGAPHTWIYSIARNLRFDMLRKQSSSKEDVWAEELWPVLENLHPDENTPTPEAAVLNEQMYLYLDQLPQAQQQVIRMVYLEDKPQQQVAEELQIPLGTVKSRVRLAVMKLQQLFEQPHD